MKVKKNEPMCNHTTWRIGGPVEVLLQPETVEELQQALLEIQRTEELCHVLGGGSNVLVADEGIAGTVIQLSGSLCKMEIVSPYITAEAGVPLPVLAQKAAAAGLSGLEFAAGIPGTIGGAVVMNAGAYDGQISDIVRQVICCDKKGKLVTLDSADCEFAYRNSRFKQEQDLVIISVKLELNKGNKEEIQARMQKHTALRKEKQPVEYPSAGSIFKNPPGEAAGRLIEMVGAKGWKQGDAMVSQKHSNFIINTGKATCEDVLQLIKRVKQAVEEQTGVWLEEEILVLGKENL